MVLFILTRKIQDMTLLVGLNRKQRIIQLVRTFPPKPGIQHQESISCFSAWFSMPCFLVLLWSLVMLFDGDAFSGTKKLLDPEIF